MGQSTCTIEGCEKPLRSRVWCGMHYARFLRHGSPHWEPPSLAERFWAKVDKSGPVPEMQPNLGPCWIWTGARLENGYGRFNVHSRVQRPAHVVAYELVIGPFPQGLEADHLCFIKPCVRPDHIEPVTHVENLRRADAAYGIRTAVTHCPSGHEYIPANTKRVGAQGRGCRACAAAAGRALRRQRRQVDQ